LNVFRSAFRVSEDRLRTCSRFRPWIGKVTYAGMFKNDPMFAEVLEIMKEDRRKDERDAGYL